MLERPAGYEGLLAAAETLGAAQDALLAIAKGVVALERATGIVAVIIAAPEAPDIATPTLRPVDSEEAREKARQHIRSMP